jgi:hypothetical protein
MARPPLEVADLMRAAGTTFSERSRKWFTWLHLKILTAIVSCRTSLLGGHIDECSHCGHRAISFNSCLMGSNSLWGVERGSVRRATTRSHFFLSIMNLGLLRRQLPSNGVDPNRILKMFLLG